MSTSNRWLVLVGGGGCGRWQAGALSAIYNADLLKGLTGIVGTSVGGLNACALALGISQGKGDSILKEAWSRIQKNTDIYTPSLLPFPSFWNPITLLTIAYNTLFGPGICKIKGLRQLITTFFGELTTDDIQKGCNITLMTRAFNYQTGCADTLQGRLQDIVLATSAVELLFPKHQGYGDGGVVDNCPIDVALGCGAKQILVVYAQPDTEKFTLQAPVILTGKRPESKTTALQDAVSNAARLVSNLINANEDMVSQSAARAEQNGVELIRCVPPSSTGAILDFTPRNLWERGVAEAALAINQAKAKGW